MSFSAHKLKRRTAATLGAVVLAAAWVAADAPPGPYFNGFETNTAGWFNYSGATVTRVPSGSLSTYANGVAAASGSYYARLGIDPSPSSCVFGGGVAPIDYGPYTNWGGYSAIFPPGGYQTGVDIYLDVTYAQTHLDTRFDWSSAISDPSDVIGVTVGGNRYGWFVQNEFDGLAIDNSFRTGIVSTPGCEVKISDGGWIVALNGDIGTFGGNAKVSLSGVATGNQEYQDHGPLQSLTVNTVDVQAVVCADDRTQASLFGHTTIDGAGSYEYEIDLKDAGEPGIDDMYRIAIPGAAYESGPQMLQGGNVQIK
jgi:hypothetical protein